MSVTMPSKGDRYVALDPATGEDSVFIEVTRASVAGWVDIRCYTWAVGWGKRMPVGLPPDVVRRDWTQADLDAQEARWVAEHEAAAAEAQRTANNARWLDQQRAWVMDAARVVAVARELTPPRVVAMANGSPRDGTVELDVGDGTVELDVGTLADLLEDAQRRAAVVSP